MPLDPNWWGNVPPPAPSPSPFRDNTDGAVTAGTMRNFAEAIAKTGIAADWFRYISGSPNTGAPYDWETTSTAETFWLQAAGTGRRTDNWILAVNDDDQAIFAYTGGTDVFMQVQLSGTLSVSGVTAGTVVQPAMWSGAGPTPDPGSVAYLARPQELVTGDDEIEFADSTMVYVENTGANTIAIGLQFTPPSGDPIESGTLALDVSDLTALVVARPSAESAPF